MRYSADVLELFGDGKIHSVYDLSPVMDEKKIKHTKQGLQTVLYKLARKNKIVKLGVNAFKLKEKL